MYIHLYIRIYMYIHVPVLQMVLKVHNVDGSTKMVAIHEQMNTRDVCILLAERNHKSVGPNWTLVEKLTDLHLGRERGRE